MTELIVAALALALGFVLGAGLGARRAILAYRRNRGASESLVRFLPDAMPHRTAGDVLAGRVRLLFGGTEYALPVPSMKASDAWLAELDAQWASLPGALKIAGDDVDAAVNLLQAHTNDMLDAVIAFDRMGVLPSRDELRETATYAEILHAVTECWLAANPLAASIVGAIETETSGTSPVLPSMSPAPTAGAPTSPSG